MQATRKDSRLRGNDNAKSRKKEVWQSPETISWKLTTIIILLLIVAVGAYLRFHRLAEVPNGLYADEAAIGYNAYSVLLTGKDEYGKFLPLYFRSFGDYKIPLYIYLSTIPIHFLGLTVFATRLLSAIAGTLSIPLVYLLLKRIPLFQSKYIPLIGTLLFAISPWSIYFSRGAFETNLAVLTVLGSVYFFLKTKDKIGYLIPATLLLSLSTYAYHAERLVAYLILPGFLVLQYCHSRSNRESFLFQNRTKKDPRMREDDNAGKDSRPNFAKGLVEARQARLAAKRARMTMLGSIGLFLITQIPHLIAATTPAFRIRATGLFYKDAIIGQASKLTIFPHIISIPLSFTREFLAQLLAYFSPYGLFFFPNSQGDHSIPEQSLFPFWLVISYLMGIAIMIKHWKSWHVQFLTLLLFSFAAIPALTKDPVASTRALPLLFPIIVVICLGLDQLLAYRQKTSLAIITVLCAFSLLLFWRSYLVLFPHERAQAWGYGFEQLAAEIKQRPNTHFVIDQSRTKPAIIELAFFLKIPPQILQASTDQSIKENYYTDLRFGQPAQVENIEFRTIDWHDPYKDYILVGDELAISQSQAKEHFLTIVFKIRDPLGYLIFAGYQTNPQAKCAFTNYQTEYCDRYRE